MKYFIFILFSMIVVHVILVYSREVANFIAEYNKQIKTGTLFIKVRSKMECISLCLRDNGCCFTNYKDSTKECIVGTPNRCHASSKVVFGWQLLRRGRNFKNKVFFHIGDFNSWSTAQAQCDNFGMRLATVSNSNENNFLKSLSNHPNGLWIGGSDSLSEGNWKWDKPTKAITFDDWGTILLFQQPQGWYIENCLSFLNCDPWGSQYQWADVNCGMNYPFLCERVLRVDSDTWLIE